MWAQIHKFVVDHFPDLVKHYLVGRTIQWIIAIGVIFLGFYRKQIWPILYYHVLSISCRLRFATHAVGEQLVRLDDYVALLERLRERIDQYCQHGKGTMKIYVYTMQLPRDWPLWGSDVGLVSAGKTALERYFLDFHEFLERAKKSSRSIDIRRIIVIDNCNGPRAGMKLRRLTEDANSDYIGKYIEMLHRDQSQALFYQYHGTWPGWLLDAVFYGVDTDGGSTQWLWGVTTNYRPGEDLLFLRMNRVSRKHLKERFVLPFGHSLSEFLDATVGIARDDMKSLMSLRQAVNNPPLSREPTAVHIPSPAPLAPNPVMATPTIAKGKPVKGRP